MRNGVIAAGVLALGLLGSACGEGSKTTPESQGRGGPYAQPSSPAPSSPGVSPSGPTSPAPSASASVSPSESVMPSAGPGVVNAKKTSLGTILVDGKGRTLYMYEKDKGQSGKSACEGPCAKEWPPFATTTTPTAGSGVKSEWLTTTTRSDGSKQVVYNGWPLYYYAKDTSPGDMKGQGITSFGAPWYVIGADTGAPITKH
jgi:predicted lipoprotein with Yx(FWY)xxD motif